MPDDIAPHIYRYLARDWGLAADELTDAKCRQLRREIPELRTAYHNNRRISYQKPLTRRAYLAAFAPRYAYILHHSLNLISAEAQNVFQPWHREEGVICLMGGGPACELYGLLDWLYSNGIEPRYLHVIILEREGYWRTFHSFLFSDLLSQQFRRTMVVPSYEAVDFPVPTGASFNRMAVNYNFAQTGMLAEARLISLVNLLSEIPDHRGIECHLRYLTRLAYNPQLIVCADSAARKRRPRMSWLKPHFDIATNFASTEHYHAVHAMTCGWLNRDATTNRIFPATGAPRWENSINRYVYIRRAG